MDDRSGPGRDPRLPEDITPGSWKVICPECGAKLPGNSLTCPECGRNFEEDAVSAASPKREREGVAYSAWADVALLVGQFTAIVGCALAVFAGIYCLFHLKIVPLFLSILSFFYSLALYVVFTRVQDMTGENGRK